MLRGDHGPAVGPEGDRVSNSSDAKDPLSAVTFYIFFFSSALHMARTELETVNQLDFQKLRRVAGEMR